MPAVKAAFLCVAGALVCALMRTQKPEFRLAAALSVGLAALFLSLDGIREGVSAMRALTEQSGTGAEASSLLIRATGISLIAEFGAQLCRDADESALAGRVELAGRVALLGMCLPLLSQLTSRLASLLP